MLTKDIELLKRAAHAAGLYKRIGWQNGTNEPLLFDRNMDDVFRYGSSAPSVRWNPLADDGDALRLVVTMGFHISPGTDGRGFASAGFIGSVPAVEYHRGDPASAFRRAIVTAAANEITEAQMQDQPD